MAEKDYRLATWAAEKAWRIPSVMKARPEVEQNRLHADIPLDEQDLARIASNRQSIFALPMQHLLVPDEILHIAPAMVRMTRSSLIPARQLPRSDSPWVARPERLGVDFYLTLRGFSSRGAMVSIARSVRGPCVKLLVRGYPILVILITALHPDPVLTRRYTRPKTIETPKGRPDNQYSNSKEDN
nr:hypothetical protein CFP56_21289 [Quercus suber]